MGNDALNSRTSWGTYFFDIADLVAQRATCPRAHIGAVMVSGNRILATGYNGAPAGQPHCTEVGCLMENGHCLRAIHAEVNAVAQLARYGGAGPNTDLVLYLSTPSEAYSMPCPHCQQALDALGVEMTVTRWRDSNY